MKKIFGRLILYPVLIVLLLQLVDCVLPYHWGNEVVNAKMEYLEDKRDQYNVFFLGSSKVYRQIIPKLFDDNSNFPNTKSFNLGSPAASNPELHYLVDHFLDTKAKKPTYVFVDYVLIGRVADVNLKTIRAKYHLGLNGLLIFFKDMLDKEIDRSKQDYYIQNTKNYLQCFLERILKVGFRKDIIKYFTKENFDSMSLEEDLNGFLSFDFELENTKDPMRKIALERRNFRFKKGNKRNITDIDKKFKYLNSKKVIAQNGLLYKSHLEQMNDLIDKAKANNYYLIFTATPPGHPTLHSVVSNISSEHKISLFNPSEYPNFFNEDMYFDDGHLNSNGAKILTTALCENFNSLIGKD